MKSSAKARRRRLPRALISITGTVARLGVLFDRAHQLLAVHEWHHDVGDDERRSSAAHDVERLAPVVGAHGLVSVVL